MPSQSNNPVPFLESPFARAAAAADVLIALDEVGRGCIAGPVVAGASVWVKGSPAPDWLPLVNDSKKLSPKRRQHLYNCCYHDPLLLPCFGPGSQLASAVFLNQIVGEMVRPVREPMRLGAEDPVLPFALSRCAGVAVGVGTVDEIDSMGIQGALRLAMVRALLPLVTLEVLNNPKVFVLIDGNQPLWLPREWAHLQQICHVDGDALYLSVGLSSVIAKCWRDNWMCEHGAAAEGDPFCFQKHKGYGTREHFQRISQFGIGPLHRRSFLKSVPRSLLQAQV